MTADASSEIVAVLGRVDAGLDQARERLFDLLRIRSISTQPEHDQDVQRAAEWLRDQLGSKSRSSRLRGILSCSAIILDLGVARPMANGSQGVELCVSVSEAGGLGSLPTAMLSPTELRDQIAAIRTRTHAPFNVNFFCHMHPRPNPEGQARWLDELARDYAEAALDPTAAKYGPGGAPFDPAMAEVVKDRDVDC